ncbi:MAG: hypothetical protein HW414_306 [Dehalococcoidia bacterium]|nr:hypothetical protein [Dehalococcoidia bacterium]
MSKQDATGRKTSFGKEAPGILLPPALLMGFAALLFHLLNLVPASLQPAQARTYESIEAAERALGVKISVPAYFPDYLRWPPTRIALQRKPTLMLSLVFSAADGAEGVLSIHQVFSPAGEKYYREAAKPEVLLGELTVPLDGREATLIIGKGAGGAPFNQVHWRKGDRYLIITTLYPPEELLKIAGSMKP